MSAPGPLFTQQKQTIRPLTRAYARQEQEGSGSAEGQHGCHKLKHTAATNPLIHGKDIIGSMVAHHQALINAWW